jgi:hypothetical protein
MIKCIYCNIEKENNKFTHNNKLCDVCFLPDENLEKFLRIKKNKILTKIDLKICKNCHLIQNIKTFNPSNGNSNPYCKICTGQNAKKYRKKRTISRQNRQEKEFFSEMIVNLKSKAKVKNIPFNLDKNFIINLFNEQKGLCALTNIPMNFQLSSIIVRNRFLASLDRIIPSLGYIKGNIRWVILSINIALSNWGEEAFKELITAYVQKNNIKI